MAVGVRHQFVRLLGRGVQAHRMIHVVAHRERQLLVGAVHRAGRGVDQMLDAIVAAGFEDVDEADQVGFHVGVRVLDRIAHAGLRGEVHHARRFEFGEGVFDGGPILEPGLHERKVFLRRQSRQPRVLEIDVVIRIEVVVAEHRVAARQQALRQCGADEPGGSRDQYAHSLVLVSGGSRPVQSTIPIVCTQAAPRRRDRPSGTCSRACTARRSARFLLGSRVMRTGSKLLAVWLCLLVAVFSMPAFAAGTGDNRENVSVDLHQMIPMRDGVQLAATIWRPSDQAKPLPVVLVMTPYITDETQARAVKFATHGYVYVSVDVRGRGSSQGKFTPLYGNGPDGADVIAWLARQPWCDGRVVTRGGSYRGMDQWQILSQHPAHLAAAVPTAAVYPGWDFPQPRGVFVSYMAQWLAFTSGQTGQDNLFGDGKYWSTRFVDAYEHNQPFAGLADLTGSNRAAFLQWLDHPGDDDYWARYNPKPDDYKSIDIPILSITGYFDGDQPGALRYYREFMANASANAKQHFYLLMGPWDHPGTRHPQQKLGGLTFDKKSVLDIDQLHIDFFDWVLKGGKRPGILSDRVNYYVMRSEERRVGKECRSRGWTDD